MTPSDLTLLLLLSNSVQNAMTGPDPSLLGGAVAACTLLLLNHVRAEFSGLNRRFRKLIEGQPSLLVHDGQVIESHVAKEQLSMDELHRALGEHGISSVDQVALSLLDDDGSITCLKYDEISPDANTHLAAGRRRFIQQKPGARLISQPEAPGKLDKDFLCALWFGVSLALVMGQADT